jgi:hypothetical protein
MIQIKLVDIYMILQCTELYLCKCNRSSLLSIKLNVNFKFQLSAMFVFLVSREGGILATA